jgi:hypothetical protein
MDNKQQITSLVISKEVLATEEPFLVLRRDINLPFTPNKIVVSHVYYEATNGDTTLHPITTNLIHTEDNVLQNVYHLVQFSQPMVFTNNKPINGTYEFRFAEGLSQGVFTMTLTFIKE